MRPCKKCNHLHGVRELCVESKEETPTRPLDLKMASKEEIQAELNRLNAELKERAEAERKAYEEKFQKRMELLRNAGTAWIDAIVPEHGRTSCNDENLGNGFHSADYGPRCTRCALLEIARGEAYPSANVVFDLSVKGN